MTEGQLAMNKPKKDCTIPVRLSEGEKALFLSVYGEGKVSSALRILGLRQAVAHIENVERKPHGL